MKTRMVGKVELPDGHSKCPRCLHVGITELDFGYRIMNGKRRSQSQCRQCRSNSKNRPAPGSRFSDSTFAKMVDAQDRKKEREEKIAKLPKLVVSSSTRTVSSTRKVSSLNPASATSASPAITTPASANVAAMDSTTAATIAMDVTSDASTCGQLLLFGGIKPLKTRKRG